MKNIIWRLLLAITVIILVTLLWGYVLDALNEQLMDLPEVKK